MYCTCVLNVWQTPNGVHWVSGRLASDACLKFDGCSWASLARSLPPTWPHRGEESRGVGGDGKKCSTHRARVRVPPRTWELTHTPADFLTPHMETHSHAHSLQRTEIMSCGWKQTRKTCRNKQRAIRRLYINDSVGAFVWLTTSRYCMCVSESLVDFFSPSCHSIRPPPPPRHAVLRRDMEASHDRI